MEWTLAFKILSGFFFAIALLFLKNKFLGSRSRLPPGPPGLPVIGNFLDLGEMPHQSLANLRKKYGPVIWLRLGAVNTMVVSSAEAAMEMFKNHDLAFADRKTNEATSVHNYDQGSMVFAEYGPYWRMLRRICTTELLTNNRINGTTNLRANGVEKMTNWMWEEAQKNGTVEVARFVALGSFNVIGNVALSKDNIVEPQLKAGTEFFSSLTRAIELSAKPNLADFYPFLRFLDLQRIKKISEEAMAHPLNFAAGFVKDRLLDRKNGRFNAKKDFLDVMLEFQGNQKDGEPAKIPQKKVNIMILELFIASTHTTSSTIEWAMTELLRHPNIMSNVQAELDKVVGQKKVEESDIGNLHYLQAVVKETLSEAGFLAWMVAKFYEKSLHKYSGFINIQIMAPGGNFVGFGFSLPEPDPELNF
ncbi:Cytochrome p450 [Thalictrum thalictroides]|uniref:Cytochrome p450 n=1 Tax=Thalictrum thalictroides TaxID=46969 RepID=A0A7J6WEZ2_THATH|nr:Cytochrome p450 [Thalictrum thalictroides]